MVAMDYDPEAAAQESYILCADCGTVIPASNGAGLCECFVSDLWNTRRDVCDRLEGKIYVKLGDRGGSWGCVMMC